MSQAYVLISGAISMGCWAIGLFFLKFWRRTRDRLFLFFAVAFWMLAMERLAGLVGNWEGRHATAAYVARLGAFVTIIIAIMDKNRPNRPQV